MALDLEPARDVLRQEEGFLAQSQEPWLRFSGLRIFPPGGFVELRYTASLYDEPVRPILRFWLGGEFREHILPGPCEGAGVWVGRVPHGTTEVWISPTNRPGPFNFRILSAGRVSRFEALRKAAAAPKRLFFALSAGMVGLTAESELNWRWAFGAAPLSAYSKWRTARMRETEPTFDRPRSDWSKGPRIVALVDARGAAPRDIETTRASVAAQTYPHCAFLITTGEAQLDAGDLVLPLVAGDRLEPYACACFVEHFARHPQHAIVSADETRGEGDGLRPVYKPGWSATLHRFGNYIGRAACFRAGLLSKRRGWRDAGADELIDGLLSAAQNQEVGALRRPLFHLARATQPQRATIDAVFRGAPPAVTLVIPTRDRVDLLAPCLDSVLRKSLYPQFDVIVVDNDSVEPRTQALLRERQAMDARLNVLRQQGAFNFSALCNAGARAARGHFLVFLNNDTEIVTPDWIERLLFFAIAPDVGAVGAKLLYPGGAVQHAGVLLGMGGVAGHFGAGGREEDRGWMGRNVLPHEVSAVTGACLMVERRKFDAVGGFDEVELPVELNDVDLCLRLRAQGWRTLCNTQATLIHRQSASRGGGALRLQRVYESERRAFYERWRAVIRDDPHFHPGLSLYANYEALP
ncbi:MAG: glycosyltransferase family 2 protein [Methylocystis sp.]|uniref:glycosyltransferase family 2 protein n=1 Tax=Methylocystis sp. TaxID=1911079 RepID=UPI003D0E4CAB